MKKQQGKNEEQISEKQVAELKAQNESLRQEIDEWKTKCMRALADYQNLERRTRDEKEEVRRFASEVILERLFPAIDTLMKAKDHLKDAGLDLAFKELVAVLQEQGVMHIKVVGEVFNPHEMECIEVVSLPAQAAGQDNKVVEEILPGYRLHDKVLRVAQVKVGKKTN